MSKIDARTGINLTEQDLSGAPRLFRLLLGPELGNAFPATAGESENEPNNRQLLLSKARLMLRGRRSRKQFFRSDLFTETGWDILLALYITEEAKVPFTVGTLAECINSPMSVTGRWVKVLEEDFLVGLIDHPTDRSIVFVRLLDDGRKALDAYLSTTPH